MGKSMAGIFLLHAFLPFRLLFQLNLITWQHSSEGRYCCRVLRIATWNKIIQVYSNKNLLSEMNSYYIAM